MLFSIGAPVVQKKEKETSIEYWSHVIMPPLWNMEEPFQFKDVFK